MPGEPGPIRELVAANRMNASERAPLRQPSAAFFNLKIRESEHQ